MEKLIHKMEKLGFGLDDDSTTCDQKQINRRESWLLSVQRCIKYLTHACQCRDANCRLPSCQGMKKVIKHAKNCKLKSKGGCQICRQLIGLSFCHVKHCQVAKCPVSYCSSIKNILKQGKLQERLLKALFLKWYMQKGRKSAAVLQTSPDNSNSSNQPSPGAEPYSSPDPPQPDIGMEPSKAPPVRALQAVQQAQVVSAGQTDPYMVAASVNYGKSNPVVSPPIPNLGLMTANQQMEAQMLNMGNVACWEGSGYAQNPQPHQNPQTQPNPQLGLRHQPTQLMGGLNNMSNSIVNSAMGPPQVMPNPGPSLEDMQTREAYQQILQIIRTPPSAQKKQQVLAILKANPPLMAAVIKERTAQLQQKQQQLMLLNEGIHNLNISK